jgi:hypothetical protein
MLSTMRTMPHVISAGDILLAVATAWLGGGCRASATTTAAASSVIGVAGGTVTTHDGSSVDVPLGALSSPTTISMASVSQSGLPGGGVSGGAAYAIGPEGATFSTPLTITLSVDPAALPPMTQASDLAIFTTSVGTMDHAYWLATRAVDATHLSAQTTHFSWFWVADPRRFVSQVTPPSSTCGIGGAACVNFDVDEAGFCSLCQCSDGSECPGGDPSQCCACSDGTSCPENDLQLCASCDAGSLAPVVASVPSQPLGPNCDLDSDTCVVCPLAEPVTCASGSCCPADHPTCCGDGRSCGVNPGACPGADAAGGDQDDGALVDAGLAGEGGD